MIRNLKAKAMVLAFLYGIPVPPNDYVAKIVILTNLKYKLPGE